MSWFNDQRLRRPIGKRPPVEFEVLYEQSQAAPDLNQLASVIPCVVHLCGEGQCESAFVLGVRLLIFRIVGSGNEAAD